jgi:hypothetical protein
MSASCAASSPSVICIAISSSLSNGNGLPVSN